MCIICGVCLLSSSNAYQQCLSPMMDITVNSTRYFANEVVCDEEFVEYMWSLTVNNENTQFGVPQNRNVRNVRYGSSSGSRTTLSTITRVINLFTPIEINGTNRMHIINTITEYKNTPKSDSCFSGNVLVPTKNGLKKLSDITTGDEFQIGDDEFIEMTGWLHRDDKLVTEFVTLAGESHSVTMSPRHFLMISKDCSKKYDYIYAGDVMTGDCIIDSNDIPQVIRDISYKEMIGFFAPFVYSDYFYVTDYVTSEDVDTCREWDTGMYTAVSPYAVEWPDPIQKELLNVLVQITECFVSDDTNPNTEIIPLIAEFLFNYSE